MYYVMMWIPEYMLQPLNIGKEKLASGARMGLEKSGESGRGGPYQMLRDIGFEEINVELKAEIANAKTLEELDRVRLKYLGKNGIVTILMRDFAKRCVD
jgi:aminoacyl tRNA synthetase class II-like protein